MTLDARLLRVLRNAPTPVPLAEIAAELGVSASVLISSVESLREAGYDIEHSPHLGLRLLRAPDRLVADDIAAGLDDCPIAREILVFQETASTNDLAAQMGRSGANHGLAVFAERQSAGRGRFARRWESQAHKGLWFSLLLRPTFPVTQWPRLTTWAAVGLAEALQPFISPPVGIKWPNDIQVQERKIAGILSESCVDATGGGFSVVGIGVNVNHAPADFPPALRDTAGSLRMAAGNRLDRREVAVALLTGLNRWYAKTGGAFTDLVAVATGRSVLLGRPVRLFHGPDPLEGIAESLDPEGALVIRMPDGRARPVFSGEVTLSGGAP